MRPNRVKNTIAAGQTALAQWASLGDPLAAELQGHSGAGAVVLDLQHAGAGPRQQGADRCGARRTGAGSPLSRVSR
jgi:2-keto-3-deoxy-L-rhamnonate aldolase RhmA